MQQVLYAVKDPTRRYRISFIFALPQEQNLFELRKKNNIIFCETHLTINSNSEKASIITANRVVIAP